MTGRLGFTSSPYAPPPPPSVLGHCVELCINVSNVPLGNIACVAARAEASGLTRRHLTTSDGSTPSFMLWTPSDTHCPDGANVDARQSHALGGHRHRGDYPRRRRRATANRPLAGGREPRGTVAVLGGRGEFIEKYFEVAGICCRGTSRWRAMDWRGQGGSERPLRNARKGHVDDFSLFERDLEASSRRCLTPHCPRPWFGLCHSMGAAVLLWRGGRRTLSVRAARPDLADDRVQGSRPPGRRRDFSSRRSTRCGLGGALPGDSGSERSGCRHSRAMS